MEGMEGSCSPSECSCFVCLKHLLNFEMPFNFFDFFLFFISSYYCYLLPTEYRDREGEHIFLVLRLEEQWRGGGKAVMVQRAPCS